MAQNTNLLKNLIDNGELPTVNIEISLSKETLVDAAAAAVIAAIVVVLLNKFLFDKI